MFGCCGNNCSTCIACLATQADDDTQRKSVAATWSLQYGASIRPEDINCDGCTSAGRHIGFAEGHCTIRKCCLGKGHATCADCEAYRCEDLRRFFEDAPAAKANLDSLRK